MKPEDDLDAWLAEANQDLADATADALDVEATLAEVRQQAATEVVTPHLVPEAVIALAEGWISPTAQAAAWLHAQACDQCATAIADGVHAQEPSGQHTNDEDSGTMPPGAQGARPEEATAATGLGSDGRTGEQGHDAAAVNELNVHLTDRELQVLRGMAMGKSNSQIGRELYLSEDTVKAHARRLFRKLGVRDRTQAVAHGVLRGLVS